MKATEVNKARMRERQRSLSPEQREAERERQRIRYAKDRLDPAYREKKRLYGRLVARFKKFGLTQEDYGYMMERCGGECPGCGCEMVEGKGQHNVAHIDHDHNTGTIRGVICQSCNLALGYVRDSVATLQRLAAHVQNAA